MFCRYIYAKLKFRAIKRITDLKLDFMRHQSKQYKCFGGMTMLQK